MLLLRSFMCRPAMATGFNSPSASVRISTSSDVRVKPKLRGVVFDMDGTLTVPVIDFALMKRTVLGDDHADIKSGNTSRIDILHQIEQWSPDRQQKAYTIITDFERQAHERLQIMPGALELCEFLDSRQIRRGLITRNIKESVDLFHLRFGIACGKRAGAITCLLDESGKYNSTDTHLNPQPDFKVNSLFELSKLLDTEVELIP